IPDHGVVPVTEQVDDLPLGLVAPLQPHHTSRRHGARTPVKTAAGTAALDRKETGYRRPGTASIARDACRMGENRYGGSHEHRRETISPDDRPGIRHSPADDGPERPRVHGEGAGGDGEDHRRRAEEAWRPERRR